MLNAVQSWMKSTLNGLIYPSVDANPPALVAYVAPPVYDDLYEHPIAFIWGSRYTYDRRTMTGGRNATPTLTGAYRELKYELDVYIKQAISNTDPGLDNNFPLLVDAVMIKLAGVPIPFTVTDATTSVTSTVLDIGEHMDVTYGDLHALNDQRLWLAEARITCRITEWVQQ